MIVTSHTLAAVTHDGEHSWDDCDIGPPGVTPHYRGWVMGRAGNKPSQSFTNTEKAPTLGSSPWAFSLLLSHLRFYLQLRHYAKQASKHSK